MAANVYVDSLALSSDWSPLAAASVVLNVWLLMLYVGGGMSPAGAVFELLAGGRVAAWPMGEPIRLDGVDLAGLAVRSTSADMELQVIGVTR